MNTNQIKAIATIEFIEGAFPEGHEIYHVQKFFPIDMTIAQADMELKVWAEDIKVRFANPDHYDIKSIKISLEGVKDIWEY